MGISFRICTGCVDSKEYPGETHFHMESIFWAMGPLGIPEELEELASELGMQVEDVLMTLEPKAMQDLMDGTDDAARETFYNGLYSLFEKLRRHAPKAKKKQEDEIVEWLSGQMKRLEPHVRERVLVASSEGE